MVKVKLCGMTSLEDAQAALEAGADLLGFIFYPRSPRYVHPESCGEIVAKLRQAYDFKAVGVFVNALPELACSVLDQYGLDLAQLSGDESTDDLVSSGERAFKAIRAKDQQTLFDIARRYPQRINPPALLVDAALPGQFGGTGMTADWKQAREVASHWPILLAGGLHPNNVAEAIRVVQPWGVDVASGVEASPGKKDVQKMIDFVRAVHQAIPNREME